MFLINKGVIITSLWLKGYDFININKIINNYLKLEKEIRFFFWPKKEKGLLVANRNLIIQIIENKEILETKIINPRKKINKNFNILSIEDNEKLNNFLNTCGKNLLEYQQNKINYEDIKKRLSNLINDEKET